MCYTLCVCVFSVAFLPFIEGSNISSIVVVRVVEKKVFFLSFCVSIEILSFLLNMRVASPTHTHTHTNVRITHFVQHERQCEMYLTTRPYRCWICKNLMRQS